MYTARRLLLWSFLLLLPTSVQAQEDGEAPAGEEAVGTVHHVAWRARDDSHEVAWRDVLVRAGREVTPVIERKYFRSIYFREPGGVLFEIATDKPGFTVDEPAEALGSSLQLPPQYEGRREKLTFNLPPIVVPTTAASGLSVDPVLRGPNLTSGSE